MKKHEEYEFLGENHCDESQHSTVSNMALKTLLRSFLFLEFCTCSLEGGASPPLKPVPLGAALHYSFTSR